jgi:hypothetical protein
MIGVISALDAFNSKYKLFVSNQVVILELLWDNFYTVIRIGRGFGGLAAVCSFSECLLFIFKLFFKFGLL